MEMKILSHDAFTFVCCNNNFAEDWAYSRLCTDFNFFALYWHYWYQSKVISLEVKILSDLYP
jgi:hypothetical protein